MTCFENRAMFPPFNKTASASKMASKSVRFYNMVQVFTISKSDVRVEHPTLQAKLAEWNAFGATMRAKGLAGHDTNEDVKQDMLDIKRRQEEWKIHAAHKKMQKLQIRVA